MGMIIPESNVCGNFRTSGDEFCRTFTQTHTDTDTDTDSHTEYLISLYAEWRRQNFLRAT